MRDYASMTKQLTWARRYQPCTDCALEKQCEGLCVFGKAADAIEELLAKVPKQGEWLPHPNPQFIEVDVCSVCGLGTRKMYHCTDGVQTWDEKTFFRYCPWCGAKLKEPPKEDAECKS